MHRISVAGHFCVDLAPELPRRARLAPGELIGVGPLAVGLGGCVANTGLFLHDLGADVELRGAVGDDWLGGLAERLLASEAEGLGALQVVENVATSYSLVLEPGGADRAFWHHTGVNAIFDAAWVRTDADLLHFGYPPLLPAVLADGAAPLVSLFGRARDAGTTVSLDLAVVDPDSPVGRLDWRGLLAAILQVTDVVSPSVDDLRSMLGVAEEPSLALADRLAGDLLELGAAVALVTAGAHGMVLRAGDAERVRAGGRVLAPIADQWADARVVAGPAARGAHATSTGAGDAASAGLLRALAAGFGPDDAVGLAAATSAAVMAGARPTPGALTRFAPELAARLASAPGASLPGGGADSGADSGATRAALSTEPKEPA
jgi:sugar/nucleoside kinase (ribokinase family)